MPPDAPAAESGLLTMDQAIAELNAADEPEDTAAAPAAQTETPNTEAEPAAEDAPEPETVIEDEPAETEEGAAEVEETELPAIEPPRFWDAAAKKRFGELPRDLQELVLTKETERDKATARTIEQSALARKAAEGEASKIAQLTGVLDKLLPQAMETYKSRWENVDWNAVVDVHGPAEALKLRNQMETERVQLQQLQAAKGQAEQVQFAKFVETETAKLPDYAPDLADPKLGPQRKTELGKFLAQEMTKAGEDPQAIKHMTAWQTSIAYDAMRWRNAQAQAKAKLSAPPTQARPATVPKPSVRPTAAPTRPGSPKLARVQALNRKSSLTMDEAVELLSLESEEQ